MPCKLDFTAKQVIIYAIKLYLCKFNIRSDDFENYFTNSGGKILDV